MVNFANNKATQVDGFSDRLVSFIGDTLPNLTLEFVYDSGGFVNLTNATVTVSVSRLNGNSAVKTGTATLRDANNGVALFSWSGFTFNSPGTYIAQAKLDYGGATVLSSQRFLIEVLARVPGL